MAELEENADLEFEELPEIISAAYAGDGGWARRVLEEDPSQAGTRDAFLGTTPLIIACHRWATHRGFREVVQALLEAGADVNAREQASGTTPLHWAAEAGNPDLIDLLADRGADLAATDEWYNLAPLGWATLVDWAPDFRNDKQGAAEKLLFLEARLDPFSAVILNEAGRLAAALRDDPAIAHERLGFLGQGQQPLHLAVVRGNWEMASILIDGGADVNALTGWGLSPLALAIAAKDEEMADRLRASGARDDLSSDLYSGNFESARRRIIEAGHKYLLHACVRSGRTKAVEALLARGVDPMTEVMYVVDEQPTAMNAIQMAIHGEKQEILRLFQEKGLIQPAASG